MNAFILSVGDELALGQTVDTNSAWLSRELAGEGCDLAGHATVSDDRAAIAEAIRYHAGRCDLLVVSGGIGPTADDLTREALGDVLGGELVEDQKWIDHIAGLFNKLNREMKPGNRKQALIPTGADLLWNPFGTAAGLGADLKSEISNGKSCRVFVLPGVPKEMKRMAADLVVPFARERAGGAAILSRTLHTFGHGESDVAALLGDLMTRDRNPSVGTTVSGGIVSLRLNCRAASKAEGATLLDETEAACREKLGDLIFGIDEETLPTAVAALLLNSQISKSEISIPKPPTVATAESCTGGLLAAMLTEVPGSSAYFRTGFIIYSNDAKYERLGVNREMLAVFGAVSEEVVTSMARSARKLAKSTYALAVSGIAGPGGGTDTKPVGTVCLALARPQPGELLDAAVTSRTFHFHGDREMVRDRSAKMALTMLRFELLGKPLPF